MKPYYRTNINHPVIREFYEKYKERLGIPSQYPMSDKQRERFDDIILGMAEQNRQKEGEENAEKADK